MKKPMGTVTPKGKRETNASRVSTLIAILALIATIYSLYLTRVQYIKSSRPYVWINNVYSTDQNSKLLIQVPSMMSCNVLNAPARFLQTNVKITLDTTELFNQTERNLIRYPNEKTDWTIEITSDNFNKIINRPPNEQEKLRRIISIDYSSIGRGRFRKTYHYKLEQSYLPYKNQWTDISVEAD
jgi:hypothetical protein